MAAKREIQTPGVAATQNQDQQQTQTADTNQDTSTKDQAEAALSHITNDDQSTGETGPSQEELLRQELAEMRAQMEELKKSTQPEMKSASGVVQPKKRIPFLTDKGWSTKEAD